MDPPTSVVPSTITSIEGGWNRSLRGRHTTSGAYRQASSPTSWRRYRITGHHDQRTVIPAYGSNPRGSREVPVRDAFETKSWIVADGCCGIKIGREPATVCLCSRAWVRGLPKVRVDGNVFILVVKSLSRRPWKVVPEGKSTVGWSAVGEECDSGSGIVMAKPQRKYSGRDLAADTFHVQLSLRRSFRPGTVMHTGVLFTRTALVDSEMEEQAKCLLRLHRPGGPHLLPLSDLSSKMANKRSVLHRFIYDPTHHDLYRYLGCWYLRKGR